MYNRNRRIRKDGWRGRDIKGASQAALSCTKMLGGGGGGQSDNWLTLKSLFKSQTLKCREPARVRTGGQVTEGLYASS